VAHGAPVVTVRASSSYAVSGLPVRVTVSSSERGTVQLFQIRPDRMLGPGRCGSTATRLIAGTSRQITAGQPITITLQPSAMAFGGGDLLAPYGWDNPAVPGYQELCFDRYSTFHQLRAEVSQSAPSSGLGQATTALQRIV
jgi:hypothetical protein